MNSRALLPCYGSGTGRGSGRGGAPPADGNWIYGATTNGGGDSRGSSTGAAIGGAATIGSGAGGELSSTVPLWPSLTPPSVSRTTGARSLREPANASDATHKVASVATAATAITGRKSWSEWTEDMGSPDEL